MREYVAVDRSAALFAAFRAVDRATDPGRAVLCIGCRNAHELNLFRDAGFADVTGIDLFSTDPRIEAMDMHATTFPARRFDVFFACHSLEHAAEPAAVFAEIQRLARANAVVVIEVPVRYRKWPGREDVHDFGSIDGLRASAAALAGRELFAEEIDTDPPIVRLIVSTGAR